MYANPKTSLMIFKRLKFVEWHQAEDPLAWEKMPSLFPPGGRPAWPPIGRVVRTGDLLAVNRALRPRAGHLVWFGFDGVRLLREYRPQSACVWLRTHHSEFPPL